MLKRIEIPVADPGNPDTRSPVRLLVWVGKHQKRTLALGIIFGIWWMLAQALMPFAIGRAIQLGIVEGSNQDLAIWTLVLLGARPDAGIRRRDAAPLRRLQLAPGLVPARPARRAPRRAHRPGDAAGRSTGEVVATVSNDAMRAGGAFDITARLAARSSPTSSSAMILALVLGRARAVVLLGVPMLVLLLGTIIKPLQARQRDAARGGRQADRARRRHRGGLRVLRGIGGEDAFFDALPHAARSTCARPASASRCRSRRSMPPRSSSPVSSSCS